MAFISAQKKLTATAQTIYTSTGVTSVSVSAIFANSATSNAHVTLQYVNGSTTTNLLPAVIVPANSSLVFDAKVVLASGGKLNALTDSTTANKVDLTLSLLNT